MRARSPALPRSLALLLAGMVAALITVAGAATPAGGQPAGARVTGVDTSDHPEVRLTVVAEEPDLEAASVTQSGDPRPVTDARRAQGDIQLMLVIDASADMADELRSTVAAATEFVLRLPVDARVGVVVAGGDAHVAAAPTDDTGAVLAALADVEADGDPALLPAVPLALDEFTTGSGRRGMVLLTGGDHGDGGSLDDVAAQLRAEGASLFGVGLEGGVMEQLAASAGGRVEILDSMDEADEALREVLHDLDHLYRVEFIASEEPGPAELSVAVGEGPESWATLTVPLSATDAAAREAAADERPADAAPAGAASAGDEAAAVGSDVRLPVSAVLALLGLVLLTSSLVMLRRRGTAEQSRDERSEPPEGGEMEREEFPVDEPGAVQVGPVDPQAVRQDPPERDEARAGVEVRQVPVEFAGAWEDGVGDAPVDAEAPRELEPDRPEESFEKATAPTESPPAPPGPEPPPALSAEEGHGPEISPTEASEPEAAPVEAREPEAEPVEAREPEAEPADEVPPAAQAEPTQPDGDRPPAEADTREPSAWHLPRWRPARARLGAPQAGHPTLPGMLADALEDEADLPDMLRWAALTIEEPVSSPDPAADAAQRLADLLAGGDDLAAGLAALGTHEHEGVDWARAAVEIHRDLGGDLPGLLRIADGAVTEQRTMTEEWAFLRLESRLVLLALVLQPIAVAALGALIATGTGAVGVGLLLAAAVLTAAGGSWLHRITLPPFDWRPSRWRRPREKRADAAAVLDLAAMAVAAGLGLPEAVRRAAHGWRPEQAQQVLEGLRLRSGLLSESAAVADDADALGADAAESVIGLLRSESAHLRRREIADLRSGTQRVRRAAVVPYLACILPACVLALVALL